MGGEKMRPISDKKKKRGPHAPTNGNRGLVNNEVKKLSGRTQGGDRKWEKK